MRDDLAAESKTPLDQQYFQFDAALTLWLSEVPLQILRNAAYRGLGTKRGIFPACLVGLS